jgi:hypothetical protein
MFAPILHSSFQTTRTVGFQPFTGSLSPVQAQMAAQLLSMLDGFEQAGAPQAASASSRLLPAPDGYHRMLLDGMAKQQASLQAQLSGLGLDGTPLGELFKALAAVAGPNVAGAAQFANTRPAQVGNVPTTIGNPGNTPAIPNLPVPTTVTTATVTTTTGTGNVPNIPIPNPTGPDKFAVTATCRSNRSNPSNLNNSPHVKLAIYNILKDNKGRAMSPKKLADELQSRYGIHAEVTTVKNDKGRNMKALKFDNGDILADGNGNGVMDLKDYNFKGAVEDIKQRYGVQENEVEKLKQMVESGGTAGQPQGQNTAAAFASQVQAAAPGGSFFPTNDIASLFAMALRYAQA